MSDNFQRPQRLNWPDLPMPTARMIGLGYVLLIIYASIYPYNFNVSVGAGILDWFTAPIPKYITSFDVFTNILGYVPLGFFTVFAVYPRLKLYRALIVAMLLGALLSGILESLQTWLGTRIPSNVDWFANIGGAILGALLAMPLDPKWLSGSGFQRRRIEWFGFRTSGILLVLAFPWAQIYPQQAWLAMGDWGFVWLVPVIQNTSFNFAAIEIITTMLAWLGASLCISLSMKSSAPKLKILLTLLFMTIISKALLSGMQFGIDKSFSWLTAPAFWGMTFSSILLAALIHLRRSWQYGLAILFLGLMIFLVNIFPKNPYYLVTIQEWRQGRLIHFNHLMAWLAWIWPIGAALSLAKGLKARSSI
jgi:VanZ family protein